MPELPDVEAYLAALRPRILGARLEGVRLANPFILRSVDPPLSAASGQAVTELRRLGKRIVIALEGELFLVLHLMIAGRLHWKAPGAKTPGKIGLAAFDFSTGTLVLTEAGTKRRAALHLVRGAAALGEHDPGGLEVLETDLATFRAALQAESHTVKRVLTDPSVFSGIGNAYSDEILHAARLSPVRLTRQLTDDEIIRLFEASRRTLIDWAERLSGEAAERFPEHVTAFRDGMAVHGRFGQPCPAARRSSASSTPRTRSTTAPAARPVAASSPTARCPASSNKTGPGPSKRWKPGAGSNRHRRQTRRTSRVRVRRRGRSGAKLPSRCPALDAAEAISGRAS